MDPNANLKEQLELALKIQARDDNDDTDDAVGDAIDQSQDASRLAELVLALDEWIKKGGFLPAAWGKR